MLAIEMQQFNKCLQSLEKEHVIRTRFNPIVRPIVILRRQRLQQNLISHSETWPLISKRKIILRFNLIKEN